MRYATHFQSVQTPQREPIPGRTQVLNSAGGYAWPMNDWARLDRFLVLGTEGGTYYASEREMTRQAGNASLRCLAADGPRMVSRVVAVSEAGRAPKNDPAVFLLALAAGKGDGGTRHQALEAVPRVCRTGTHLFQFLDAVQGFRGWGRGLRRAIGNWYTTKDADVLAYQLIKYRQRGGWTHRDALRLSKPNAGHVPALRWVVGKETDHPFPALIDGLINAERAQSSHEIVKIIATHPGLPWEAVPSQFLRDAAVWDGLLAHLPMTAMVRNLGRMTAIGLLTPMSAASQHVIAQLRNPERIRRARLHPIALLGALCTYQLGRGVRGSLSWSPMPQITDALDHAFDLAFGNIPPTNTRTMLGLDVSGSMNVGTIAGMPGVSPRVAAAAMAMVTARTEPHYAVMAFCRELVPLPLSPRQRLDDVCRLTRDVPFGETDCALPVRYAMEHKIPVETFIVYTDNETWAGPVHASQALTRYRQRLGIAAKLIVVGMVSNGFTIADPNDGGMLDIVGFDTATPRLMNDFAVSPGWAVCCPPAVN